MGSYTDIAIIGAGPYGLSLASYLKAKNMDFRIFGNPMSFWLNNMPKGMELKSTGYSSNLYAPNNEYTVSDYCKENSIDYEDVGLPVKIKTFCDYALEFQRRYVPDLENERLNALIKNNNSYYLSFESGLRVEARNVIVAVGLDSYRFYPSEFENLPKDRCHHSADISDLKKFENKKVAVIGSGSSAIDIAILLHESNSHPVMISRKSNLEWGEFETSKRSILEQIVKPMSGVGPGWKNRLTTELIALFPYLPKSVRLNIVNNFLGPAGGWFMKERMAGVEHLAGCLVKKARTVSEEIELDLKDSTGDSFKKKFDAVVLGTGYKFDIDRLKFIDKNIKESIKKTGSTPSLSANFESSLTGLYFIGPISSTTFGPSMRFTLGAKFASRRLSSHLHEKCLNYFRNYPGKATSTVG